MAGAGCFRWLDWDVHGIRPGREIYAVVRHGVVGGATTASEIQEPSKFCSKAMRWLLDLAAENTNPSLRHRNTVRSQYPKEDISNDVNPPKPPSKSTIPKPVTLDFASKAGALPHRMQTP